jgi:hypothetical protein
MKYPLSCKRFILMLVLKIISKDYNLTYNSYIIIIIFLILLLKKLKMVIY